MGEDTRWQEREPTTHAELYDMLRWAFGIGSYDEYEEPHQPYFKARLLEIAKLKAQMTRYKVTIADVALAARYLWRRGTPVRWPSEVIKALPDAQRARRQEALVTDLDKLIAYAIEREHSLADKDSETWINRLSRAQGDYRKEVVREWQLSRIATTSA